MSVTIYQMAKKCYLKLDFALYVKFERSELKAENDTMNVKRPINACCYMYSVKTW